MAYKFNEIEVERQGVDGREVGDPQESWVFAMPVGTHVAKDPTTGETFDFEADEETLREIASETRRMIHNFETYAPDGKSPVRPPIQVEHRDDGRVDGVFSDAKISGDGEARGLYLRAEWNGSTWADIQSGEARFTSPGIKAEYVDEQGEKYGPVVPELTITKRPRLKTAGTIQDTLDLEFSETTTPEERKQMAIELEDLKDEISKLNEKLDDVEEPEDGEESGAYDEIVERLDSLEQKVDQTPEPEDDEDEPEPEDGGDDEQGADFSEVLDRLDEIEERQKKAEARAELQFSETGRTGSTPSGDASEKYEETLAKVKDETDLTGAAAVAEARSRL